MTLAQNFRANLRARVTDDPRSMRILADVSGYSASYIGRVMAGTMPNPTLLFVETMAATLNTTPTEMLRDPA